MQENGEVSAKMLGNEQEMRELIEKVQDFEKEHNFLRDERLEQEKTKKIVEELQKNCENLQKVTIFLGFYEFFRGKSGLIRRKPAFS